MIIKKEVVFIPENSLYYKWFWACFAILLWTGLLLGCGSAETGTSGDKPLAVQGTLDLEAYRFDQNGTVRLDGEWDFYWDELIPPEQLASPDSETAAKREQILLPGSWNGLTVNGERIGGFGYATYHLRVELDDTEAFLGMRIPYIRTAYKIWVNGQPVGGSGEPGKTPDTYKPLYTPQLTRFHNHGGPMDIVIQASNFHHRSGGIWKSIQLGELERLDQEARADLARDLLLIGSLLSMGLYHIGLYALRSKEQGSLYFGLFCVLIGVRALFIGEGVIYYFVPGIPWLTALRIEYLCFYIGVPVVMMFVRSMYPNEVHRGYVRIVQWLGLLFSVSVFLLPSPWMTYTVPPFQIVTLFVCAVLMYGIFRALVRKRDGAMFAFIGVCSYIFTVILDILYYNQWINIGEVSSYGLLVCVFMTAFILSVKSAKAFTAVETLSRQMSELNTGLEQKIRERTAELERINRSLERVNEDLGRMETSRRHLLSNISHDLGTPMTLIQGYAEALLDGVVSQPEQQKKYLKLILGRITGLNRLISDLFQLSKLEARQMNFNFHPMSTDELIRYFDERYELELADAGLRFETNTHTFGSAVNPKGVVRIDLDRIDQVLTNIIYNAVKHTPRGGLIQLQFIIDKQTLVAQVQDNGSGIAPEDLPYVFDRFYKKDKSRNTAGGGSGLGLAIAKEIIDYHGGRIWAQSQIGQGACIAFMLPLVKQGE